MKEIMFIREFKEEIENPPKRSRWNSRKVAVFSCDHCQKEFEVRKNIKRKKAFLLNFCGRGCASQAKKNGGIIQIKSAKKNLKLHGVTHMSQRKDVIEKRKNTFLQKYGVENPSQLEVAKKRKKETSMKNFGVDNPLKSKKIRERIIKTVLGRHGVENPQQNRKVKEKTKITNLAKYGVENPFQNEIIKEKIKAFYRKNYGVEHNSQTSVYKEKYKQTSLERYGTNHPLSSKEVRNKILCSNLKIWGTKHPTKTKAVKEKTKQTNIKKYGVEYPTQSKKFKKQTRKTFIQKYGTINSWKTPYKIITETNQSLAEWYQTQLEPNPGYTTLCKFFVKQNISIKELNDFIKNWKSEKTQLEFFTENLFNIKHYNKKPKQLKKLYRPDFRLSPKIFLNVDGLYWHSEAVQKDKKYHFKLRQEFEQASLRIFQFREDEIRDKSDIVKSIVNNALGKTKNRIFARKCKIKSVKQLEASHFLDENHLMGSTNAKHLGLFFENKLVSLLSYKQRKNICKIERFCSIVDTNVVGGFSKLLSHLERNYLKPETTEIHNWVDLRYGTGNHLKAKGFEQIKETLGWKWTNCKITYNRLRCRANIDKRKLTQQQHADELGWVKIYDAGQRLWVRKIS